jgi:short-subunit dehydrogenase
MKKSILITGCSSGIGLCAAETLHKKGYRVFATARKEQDVAKLNALGLESYALNIDDSHSIRTVLSEILVKTGGTLDAVFNNAGYGQGGAIDDLTRDIMRAQFETNVFGPMELITQILPVMRNQGHGRIIQNTSILGIITMPYYGAYNASKFALEAFSSTLRQELRGTDIYVSIIAPGPIKSRFRDTAYQNFKQTIIQHASSHQNLYKKLENFFAPNSTAQRRFTLPPDAVVKKLLAALESRKPKAHYYVTFPAHLMAFLKRILPDRALDWIVSSPKLNKQLAED